MMATKIKGTYRIEYGNGMVQYKNLISDEDFENVVKPSNNIIGYLETFKKTEVQVHKIKSGLIELFGDEFFTVSSPLGIAIKSGVLVLLENQGREYRVKLVRK